VSDFKQIVEHFKTRDCPKGHCYRCWQVGKSTKATLGVVYNKNSQYEWSAPSCDICFARDRGAFGRSQVSITLALVGVGKHKIK
jgi:hypothetical protein